MSLMLTYMPTVGERPLENGRRSVSCGIERNDSQHDRVGGGVGRLGHGQGVSSIDETIKPFKLMCDYSRFQGSCYAFGNGFFSAKTSFAKVQL